MIDKSGFGAYSNNVKFERKTFKLLIGGILQAMLAVCRGISLKVKLSNNLLVAVLQAMLAVCRGINMII